MRLLPPAFVAPPPLLVLLLLVCVLGGRRAVAVGDAEETKLLAEIAGCMLAKSIQPESLLAAHQPPDVAGSVNEHVVNNPEAVKAVQRDVLRMRLATADRVQHDLDLMAEKQLVSERRPDGTWTVPKPFEIVEKSGSQSRQSVRDAAAAAERTAKTEALRTRLLNNMEAKAVDGGDLTEKQQKFLQSTIRPTLVDKLEAKVASGGELTETQQKVLQTMRTKAFMKQLGSDVKLTAGVSVVMNIKLLFRGDFANYLWAIGKDAGVTVLRTGTTQGLCKMGLRRLAPGAGVLVCGALDAVTAARTGDWARFGLNFGLNTCSAGGALLGAQFGASVGTALGPFGAAAGGFVGAMVGGAATYYGMAQGTPLGATTQAESAAKVEALAKEMKSDLVGLDTSLSWDEINKHLQQGNVPLKPTQKLIDLQKNTVSMEDVRAAIGEKTTRTLLEVAGTGVASREASLRAMRDQVCAAATTL